MAGDLVHCFDGSGSHCGDGDASRGDLSAARVANNVRVDAGVSGLFRQGVKGAFIRHFEGNFGLAVFLPRPEKPIPTLCGFLVSADCGVCALSGLKSEKRI